jgi:hypothetical protein
MDAVPDGTDDETLARIRRLVRAQGECLPHGRSDAEI